MVYIAIIGIGCRYPGGVHDASSFWDFIMGKRSRVSEIPPERFSVTKFYDPDPDAPGRMYTKSASFLSHSLRHFDADFFGISPREAELLDPQQRLLLEVSWEALDDAGHAGRVAGRDVGTFIGGFTNDSMLVGVGPYVRSQINNHTAMSGGQTLLSNRLAYALDLHGASLTVDTACSSSLVAVHLGVQAINTGECELALIGGANVMTQPETFISMCKGRFLAVDGRCKSFDAAADGYGRGEGVGIVVLKDLAAARADGDRIYGVIRGSGINQDGRTMALPVPSAQAQRRLAERVCATADIDPLRVCYIEAHGTGTPIGDPIEAEALGAIYGSGAGRTHAVAVGSVKNNFGHTEAAAGVAGVIKGALTVYHRQIAPQARVNRLNPNIPFDDLRLRLALETEPLPVGDGELGLVAVNGFGYGGTNAHVLIEQAPQETSDSVQPAELPVPLRIPVSGRSEAALRELAGCYADLLAGDAARAAHIAAAAWTRRAHHKLRTLVTGDNVGETITELHAVADGSSPLTVERVLSEGNLDPVFVFSGMGPQWWGMAGELLRDERSVFAQAAGAIDECFAAESGWSIIRELLKSEDDSQMTRTEIAQPATFLVQAALVAHLAQYGVRPAAVVGHSVGEVAAAYVSGAVDLEDALRISLHRARLQALTAGCGGMIAIERSAEDAEVLLGSFPDLDVAAINGPSAVTVAGPSDALAEFEEKSKSAGVFARMLRVEVPYHSRLMDPILDDLRFELRAIQPRTQRIPLYSTVYGALMTGNMDADYWADNVRRPVRFADTVAELLNAQFRVFVEIAPHPVLSGNIAQCITAAEVAGAVVPTLTRNGADHRNLDATLARLYSHGSIDSVSAAPDVAPHIDLPPYPWQRKEHWYDESAMRRRRYTSTDFPALLGDRTTATGDEWEVELSVSALPWLHEHVVSGLHVLPGAAYLDAAVSAAVARTGRTSVAVEGVRFVAPLIIADHDVPVVRLSVEPSTRRFTIRSRAAISDTWTVHAHGRLVEANLTPETVEVAAPDATVVGGTELYEKLRSRGLDYGASFQRIRQVSVALVAGAVESATSALPDVAVAALSTVPTPTVEFGESSGHTIHPAVVDAGLHCVAALLIAAGDRALVTPNGDLDGAAVPVEVGALRYHHPIPENPLVKVVVTQTLPRTADIFIADDAGRVAVSMTSVRFARVGGAEDIDTQLAPLYYEPQWDMVDISAADAEPIRPTRVLITMGGTGPRPDVVVKLAQESLGGAAIEITDPSDEDAYRGVVKRLAELAAGATERIALIIVIGSHSSAPVNVYGTNRIARVIADTLLGSASMSTGVDTVIVTYEAMTAPGDIAVNLPHAALVGARRTLRNEQALARWALVDLDTGTDAHRAVEIITTLPGRGDEIAVRNGHPWSMRILPTLPHRLAEWEVPAKLFDPEANFTVEFPRSRVFADLSLRQIPRPAPGADEIEVRLDGVGLNFKDSMKVLGVLGERQLDETYFGTSPGMEGMGSVTRVGDRVTGVAVGEPIAVSSRDMLRRYVTVKIDDGATMAAGLAGGCPEVLRSLDPMHCGDGLPYLTAIYGLRTLAKVQPGEVVLVHGAAGGMGLAAVQVARQIGATVIATASTPERRAAALDFGAHHALDSRSIDFVSGVRALTDGHGADVVYSSSPAEIIHQNLLAAAEFGRIVELGKADVYFGGVLELAPFDKNLAFFSIDMDRMLKHRPHTMRALTREAIIGLADGTYRHLPYTAYPISAMRKAFEAVARSSHIGRVVLDLRESRPPVKPRLRTVAIDPAAMYLVTGGFGAFGIATARWLVREGARHITLVGRSGANASARTAIDEMVGVGVDVIEECLDVTDLAAVAGLFARIQTSSRPLRGIFHTAGVVVNHSINEVSLKALADMFAPKVQGALNLDLTIKRSGVQLDMFVLYSSISAVAGTGRQLGYAAANAALDALAAQLRLQGTRAFVIDWGGMSGGMVGEKETGGRLLELFGYRLIDMDLGTRLMKRVLDLDIPHTVIADVDWRQWAAVHAPSVDTARFTQIVARPASDPSGSAVIADILALPPEERPAVITMLLADELARVLRIPVEELDLQASLTDLGMDSLMAMELGNRASKTFAGMKISVLEFSSGHNLTSIGVKLANRLTRESATAADGSD